MDLRRERRSGNTIIGILLILIVMVAAAALYIIQTQSQAVEASLPLDLEHIDSRISPIKQKLFAMPTSKNEPGKFSYQIHSTLKFDDATDETEFAIENPANNLYLMVVELVQQPEDEVIFRSGYIPPGYRIAKATLDTSVGQGEHAATAIFYALDPETRDIIGMLEQPVALIIKK